MHIVAFTGHYHPFMKPPERCVDPFLQNLSEDHELEIICPIYDRRYKKDFIKGKIKLNFVDSFPNKVKSFIQTNRETKQHRLLNSFLFWTYRAVRFVFSRFSRAAYEDSSLEDSVLQKAEKINKDRRIDVIISVSLPFYSHAAAFEYKKRHPEVRWITFTTDPLAYNEANPVVGYKRKRAIATEQSIYETCNYCISTEELYPNLTDDYNISPQKVLRLPFMLTNQPTEDRTQMSDRINVLYAGYVYHKIRNPKLMMETFKRIKNVEFNLHIAGDRHCRKYLSEQFPSYFHINGLVPRDKYLELLTKNDVFVNLSNNIRLQAPSKLLELISTGKPVINFYYHKDSGYNIVERYPLGINVSTDHTPDAIAEILTQFIEDNAKKRMPYSTLCEIFNDYLFENQLPKVRAVVLNEL